MGKQNESELDRKLLAWLEREAPWLMHMDSTKVMARVGMSLNYGALVDRSLDDSLAAAKTELRKEYDDARRATESDTGTGNGGRTTGNGNGRRGEGT